MSDEHDDRISRLIGHTPKELAILEEKARKWDILERGQFVDAVTGIYCREAVRVANEIAGEPKP